MKYSSNVRIVNLVLFAILFAGFGALGIWAGILVAPFSISEVGPIDLPDMSVALSWELGALGIAGAILAGFGLVFSIRSMMKANDDNLVRDSLSCYLGLGFLVVIFLLLNGTWLYRLTTTNFGYSDLGFAIAFFIVLAIIFGVALSVPLVKMHGDDANQNSQMSLISAIAFAVNAGIAIPGLLLMIFSKDVGSAKNFMPKLAFTAFMPTLAAILSLVALIGYHKGAYNGKVRKVNGAMFEISLTVDGLAFIGIGCFSYLLSDEKGYKYLSFVASSWTGADLNFLDFSVMSWIIGSLIILFVFCVILSSLFSTKNRSIDA
jgi:hypothetical protein